MRRDINHNEENQVFRTTVEGQECYLKYRKKGPSMLEFYEVVVPVKENKQGISTELSDEALRYAQKNNFWVIPTSDLVADFMYKHHEYAKIRAK